MVPAHGMDAWSEFEWVVPEAVYGGEKMPVDSWGNEFRYVSPGPGGHDFDIMSLGADGNEGGSGNDADLKWSEVGQ